MAECESKSKKRSVEHILTIEVRNAQPKLASFIKKRISHSIVAYAIKEGIIERPQGLDMVDSLSTFYADIAYVGFFLQIRVIRVSFDMKLV